MLKCENLQPQISAYLDREMPLWKVQLIRWHLKRCPECAHDVTQLQQTHKIIRQLPFVKTSEDFLSDVMCRVSMISANEKRQVAWIRRIFRKMESALAWAQYSIRIRTPLHAVGVTLALLVTIASVATFYYPFSLPVPSEDTPMLVQSPENKSIIHVELIPIEYPPKRHLSPGHQPAIWTNP